MLVERLESHRFIIRHEIRNLIRKQPVADGSGGAAPQPDSKSIVRMVEQLERAGKLKRVMLTLPVSRSQGTKAAEVLIKPDVEVTASLVNEVSPEGL